MERACRRHVLFLVCLLPVGLIVLWGKAVSDSSYACLSLGRYLSQKTTLPWRLRSDSRAPAATIDRRTLGKLKLGMTEKEIESLLGVPAGDYATRPTFYLLPGPGFINPSRGNATTLREWCFDSHAIEVHFKDGKAVRIHWGAGGPQHRSDEEDFPIFIRGAEIAPMK